MQNNLRRRLIFILILLAASPLLFVGGIVFQVNRLLQNQPSTPVTQLLTPTAFIFALVAIVAAFVVAAVLGIWVVRRVVVPIEQLAATAQAVAAGDFSQSVTVSSQDEIGTLALSFNQMVQQLREVVGTLENRVAERTRDLALAAEVGRGVSALRDLDGLLNQSVNLIRERFNLYHAQIYLVNAQTNMLVLRASTGSVGEKLIEQHHQLPITLGSLNGTAVLQKHPIIVENTQTSLNFRPNPLLPLTRSEISIPLIAANEVIGVLDLQNNQPGTFSTETLPAFEAMAGQLAVAIQNATRFSQSEKAQETLEEQSRRLTRRGWEQFLDAIEHGEFMGYRYETNQVTALETPLPPPTTRDNILNSQILVAGEPVGIIQVEATPDHAWVPEDAELISAVAQQVGQQVENLRLLAEAERYREEAEEAARRLTLEGWVGYGQKNNLTGFVYNLNHEVSPLAEQPLAQLPGELQQPLMVRDEVIGQLDLEIDQPDEKTRELVTAVAAQLTAHIENLRLTEQTNVSLWEARKSSNELALINRVVSSVAGSLDLSNSLEVIAKELAHLLLVDQVAIAILDETGNLLNVVAEYHANPHSVSGIGFKIPVKGNSITEEVLTTREMMVITDAQNNPLADPIRDLVRQRLIESLYVLPIAVGNEVIGTVGIDVLEPKRMLSSEDLRLAQTIVFQAATVIQNSRLFEQTQAVLAETQTLYDVTTRLNGVSSLQQLLEISVGPAIEARAALATLWLLEVNGEGQPEWLTLTTKCPDSPEEGLPLNTRLAVSASSTNQLWLNHPNVPVFVADNREEGKVDEVACRAFCQGAGGSLVFMPLAFGAQWLGLIVIHWAQPHRFSARDHRLYQSLTVQTAVVLNNQLLLQQTQQNATRLARFSEVQTRLSQAFDEGDILQAVIPLLDLETSPMVTFSYLTLNESGEPTHIDPHTNWVADMLMPIEPRQLFALQDFPSAQLWLHNPNEVSLLADVMTSPQVNEETRAMLTQLHIRSVATIPLYSGGRWQGILTIQWPAPHQFSADESFLLQQLQRPLASVVASRRAYLLAEAARQESERRAEELAVINQVSEVISQQTDFSQLLQTVLERVRRIMPVEGFVVGLYDQRQNILSYPLIFDDGELYNFQAGPPNPNSQIFQVIQSGQPTLLNYTPEEVAQLQAPTIGKAQLPTGLIYTPLRSGAQVIGAISVQTYHGHYNEANVSILGGIADHLAVAIENTRLFNQTQQRAAELVAINEISQVATSQLELHSLIEAVGQKIIDQFQSSGGYMAVYHKQSNVVEMPFFIDASSRERIYLPPLPLGQGVTSLIIRNKRPLLVPQATEERMLELGAKFTGNDTQPTSFLGVPMIVGDEVVGAISLQNMPGKPAFTEADQQLMMTIATTVGVAIQNAILFEQTQRRAEREQLVNEITQKIQSTVTIESALQAAVQELGQSLQARFVRIGLTKTSSHEENGVKS